MGDKAGLQGDPPAGPCEAAGSCRWEGQGHTPLAAQRLRKQLGSGSPALLKGWVLEVQSRATPRAAAEGTMWTWDGGRQAGRAQVEGS